MRKWGLACIVLFGCSSRPVPAPPELASVDARGGPVMAHPRIVTITFDDDPDRDALEAHAAWMMGSSWLTTVGAEYGVGAGSVLGNVRRTDPAPIASTDDEVETLLADAWADGSLPRPDDGDLSNVLYVVHYPIGSTVTQASGAASCAQFLAYHSSMRRNGVELVYAVEIGCPAQPSDTASSIAHREAGTAHELFEAATDGFPDTRPGFRLRDPNDPWLVLGSELADLCEASDDATLVMDGAFAAPRVWSNAAAAALDRSPCIPAPAGDVYFNVAVLPDTRVRMRAGDSRSFVVTGWSTGPVANWRIFVAPIGTNVFSAELAVSQMGPGGTTTLTIHAPASAPDRASGSFVVASGHAASDVRFFPVWVTIDPPCASHTTCEECATRGCGWCATSNRCEVADADGSAESGCNGDAWAHWAGACTNGCASHTTCADCASSTGCGWCDGVGCMAASDDYASSADGSCRGEAWSFVPRYCP